MSESVEDQAWITPNEATEPFFTAAKDGVLKLQHCTACAAFMYPHKNRCQRCGSPELTWRAAAGTGTLYAHAMLHRQYHPRHEGRLPIVLAWIDLPEGVRMPSNVVGSDPKDIQAGAEVRVDFESDPTGIAYPVFRLANA